jgi:type IV secretion/conjugal transfer VirB4 family ATPase
MQLLEHRSQPQGLADLLLYDSLVEEGILLQQDGSLLAAWSFRGPDMASATHAEMAALSARLNNILRLGSGWMIHCDAIRTKAPDYPSEGAFPDTITRIIDAERREQFTAQGTHFDSDYFLTLTYLPPPESEERVAGWLFEGQKQRIGAANRALSRFRTKLASFEDVFKSLFVLERLRAVPFSDNHGFTHTDDQLLRYLRRCVTGEDHPFQVPEIPVHLNDIIAGRDFCAGIEPMLGNNHVRIIAIDGFPRLSCPGMLATLDSLPIEYRWNTRAVLLDPEEGRAFLDKTRKKWRSRIRGWKDQIFRTQDGPINIYAQEMAADAEEAMGVASSGDVQFAFYSSVLVCMDQDRERADEAASIVAKTIQNHGFSCRLETVNAIEAWRGSLPGDGYRNVRRVVLHTLNLADLLPITSVWAGLRENPSALMPPNSPSLLYAATTGATPFRFNLHVSDLGHTLIVGPPGAGKSTLLGLLTAQWFRYPGAQVFAFDKGYSLFVLTRAANGEFYDIGGEKTHVAFCPLREIDSDQDLAWAVEWLEGLCVAQGAAITPKERNAIAEAVVQLRLSPTRTLTEFCAEVQDGTVRDALQFYTLGGPLGQLLDAEEDVLGSGRLVTFETETLMNLGDKAVIAVLLYLFRRVEKRLDGRPTLVPLDEAWAYLKHPLFRERLRDWLKTLRKRNGVVVLATQNLSDIVNSPIGDVILETCPTKVLLPNAEALNPSSRTFYDRLGLNERELSLLQTSMPKRDYYVLSPLGRRLIGLGLGTVALSFVGVNGREDRESAARFMDEYAESWPYEWLKSKGVPDWAEYYQQLVSNQGRQTCEHV